MYNAMKNLIGKRFYASGDAAQDKLDVFFAVGRLTEDNYMELTLLVSEIYPAAEATA